MSRWKAFRHDLRHLIGWAPSEFVCTIQGGRILVVRCVICGRETYLGDCRMNRRGHRGRVDGNHTEIVLALRKMGCSVVSLASIGGGCPDLLVGLNGRNVLIEVKQPGRRLNDEQMAWFGNWRGHAQWVESAEEAIALVRAEAGR